MMTWHFGVWGAGWAVFVAVLILLGILLLPWFFFLLNLRNLLNHVSDRNRAMPAGRSRGQTCMNDCSVCWTKPNPTLFLPVMA